MPDMKPEDLATWAKQLLETQGGQWLVQELKRRKDTHMRIAEGTDAHNLTVNGVMRCAGLQEAIDLIENNAKAADTKLFKR